jgi:hypothetical protein
MKRTASICLALALLLALTACGSSGSTDTSNYDEGYQAGYEAAMAEIGNSPAASPAPSSEPENTSGAEGPTTPEETLDVGTRKNPANVGDAVDLTVSSNSSGTGDMQITLEEVISGDEAWNMISAANQFNDEPGEEEEYILAKFSVTFVTDTSGEDTPLKTDKYDFDYATTDYSVSNNPSIVLPDPELDLTLYAGATGEGWVGFLVNTDETEPHAVYIDRVWFKLK